jgi:hypothetical protein
VSLTDPSASFADPSVSLTDPLVSFSDPSVSFSHAPVRFSLTPESLSRPSVSFSFASESLSPASVRLSLASVSLSLASLSSSLASVSFSLASESLSHASVSLYLASVNFSLAPDSLSLASVSFSHASESDPRPSDTFTGPGGSVNLRRKRAIRPRLGQARRSGTMNRRILGRVVAPVAFVAGGWFAATAANGQIRPPEPSKEVLDLQARVKALEAWHAQAGTFAADATGNWSFAPPSGAITLRSTQSISVRADQALQLRSGTSANLDAATDTTLSAGNQATLKGAQTTLKGGMLFLNAAQGGGRPAATVGSTVNVGPAGGGEILTGSNTVLVGQ